MKYSQPALLMPPDLGPGCRWGRIFCFRLWEFKNVRLITCLIIHTMPLVHIKPLVHISSLLHISSHYATRPWPWIQVEEDILPIYWRKKLFVLGRPGQVGWLDNLEIRLNIDTTELTYSLQEAFFLPRQPPS